MLKAVGRTGYPVLIFSLLCRPTSRLLRTEPFWQCLLCQSSIAMGPLSNPVSSSPQRHGNMPLPPAPQVVSRSSRPQGPRRPQTWLQRLSQQQHQQPSPSPQQLSEHPLQQQPHEPIVCKEQLQQQFATPYAQVRQQRARMLSHASHSRQQTHSQPQQQQVQARSSTSSNSSTTAAAKAEAVSAERPASARQQYSSPYAELAAARRAWGRQQQQQRANAHAAAAPRPTSSSASAISAAAAPSRKQLQQHRPPQARSYSRGGSLPVIAASAYDSYAAKAAGAAFPYRRSSSRTTSTLTPQQASKHSRSAQAAAAAGQQQQQEQVPWHDFSDSSSRSLTSRQQQHLQQQELLPELLQLPTDSGPVSIDITHLLSLQAEAEGEDTSSSSSKKRQSKLSMLQRQLRALQSQYGQQQQLLWVSVHQLQGPAGPAAVWVQPWAAAFDVEQLRVVAGPGGKDTVLCELQERPDLGQQPMAVVEGLRFLPGPSNTGSTSSSSGSSGSNGGDGSGSSGSSSVGCVYDCLVLSSGDFSPLEHENMFPNAMVHCGDGRQMHSARVSGPVLVT
jgi:hypothetical protein